MKIQLPFGIAGRRVSVEIPEISVVNVRFFGDDLKLSRLHHDQLEGLTNKERGRLAKYLDDEGRDCVPIRALWASLRSAGSWLENPYGFLPAKPELELTQLTFGECFLEQLRATKGKVLVPHYRKWSCDSEWEVIGNPDVFLRTVEYAGREIGIGINRPERNKSFGRFKFDLIDYRRARAA